MQVGALGQHKEGRVLLFQHLHCKGRLIFNSLLIFIASG